MPGLRIWFSKNCSPKEKESFKLKLRENSHEVMADYYHNLPVALQVTAREVMTFFLKISTISGYITRFPEIVAPKSDDLHIMPWLACREISSTGILCRQTKKVWGPLIYSLTCLNVFNRVWSVKCGPQQ